MSSAVRWTRAEYEWSLTWTWTARTSSGLYGSSGKSSARDSDVNLAQTLVACCHLGQAKHLDSSSTKPNITGATDCPRATRLCRCILGCLHDSRIVPRGAAPSCDCGIRDKSVYPVKPSNLAALPPKIFCLSSSEIFNCFTVSTARASGSGTGGESLPKTTWSTPMVSMAHCTAGGW